MRENKTEVSVIILTLNEEIHIERCLGSLSEWADQVIVLDSCSSDQTSILAYNLGAEVFTRKFDNYANQRQFAINELPVKNEWILFLDADEYLTDELKKEIDIAVKENKYDGYFIKFRFYFLGRWIKHGYYPTWILRLFKKGTAELSREMNEHIQVHGRVGYLEHDFIHEDKKDLAEWITKHNRYSGYEAQQLYNYDLRREKGVRDKFADLSGTQAQKKRWIREHIWNPLMPPFVRPFIYFLYRYVLRAGFLDGKAGLIYHFLQGLWYPFLIDVKYLELKRKNSLK